MTTQITVYAIVALAVALLAAVFVLSHVRRQLRLERAKVSDLRRRMRRVATAALVVERVGEADVKALLGQGRPITVDEVAGLLERRQEAA